MKHKILFLFLLLFSMFLANAGNFHNLSLQHGVIVTFLEYILSNKVS